MLIENRGKKTGLVAVQQSVLRRRVAHAFQHHLQQHAFELLSRLLQTGLRVLLDACAQVGTGLQIEDKVIRVEVFGFHGRKGCNFRANDRLNVATVTLLIRHEEVSTPVQAEPVEARPLRQAANSSARFAGGGAERNYGIRSATTASAGSTESTSPEEYVNRVWPHAVEAANSIGVPPQFLIAQSALETGWGKSEIRRADGSPSYNLFGVKAGRSWQGDTVEVQTTEYVNGEPVQMREKFRVYGSYAESFNDYANLIRNNARFSGVVGQTDGTQFARSLQQSGYATDPMYADKLSRIINGTTLRQALAG